MIRLFAKTWAMVALVSVGIPVSADTFAQVCRSPSYTVLDLYGVGTQSATLVAITTEQDINKSCSDSALTQGTMTAEQCRRYYASWSKEELTITVQANCADPTYVIFNGGRLDVEDRTCSGGGFHAVESLRLLCPASD